MRQWRRVASSPRTCLGVRMVVVVVGAGRCVVVRRRLSLFTIVCRRRCCHSASLSLFIDVVVHYHRSSFTQTANTFVFAC